MTKTGAAALGSEEDGPSAPQHRPEHLDRILELLLRLHANSLWPAMHPGTLPFNAVPENAKLSFPVLDQMDNLWKPHN